MTREARRSRRAKFSSSTARHSTRGRRRERRRVVAHLQHSRRCERSAVRSASGTTGLALSPGQDRAGWPTVRIAPLLSPYEIRAAPQEVEHLSRLCRDKEQIGMVTRRAPPRPAAIDATLRCSTLGRLLLHQYLLHHETLVERGGATEVAMRVVFQTTLDGYFEGKTPWDLEFHDAAWGDELKQFSLEQAGEIGTVLYGRATYEGMASHWTTATGPVADFMNEVPKVVFSRTLDAATWKNARLVRRAAADEVVELKPGSPRQDLSLLEARHLA